MFLQWKFGERNKKNMNICFHKPIADNLGKVVQFCVLAMWCFKIHALQCYMLFDVKHNESVEF
jgi:hypothetical protein